MGTDDTGRKEVDISRLSLERISHTYLTRIADGQYTPQDVDLLKGFLGEILKPENAELPRKKVGLMFVCINRPYWQYLLPVLEGVQKYFLPGHDVETMVWTDIPQKGEEEAFISSFKTRKENDSIPEDQRDATQEDAREFLDAFYAFNTTQFTTDSIEWPYPTLMRYHLFLAQEEYLKQFDYLFYLDLDMRIVNYVGDEMLGDGLTAAQHPMYALRQSFWYPYEPNPESAAYIKTPGRLVQAGDKNVFQPLYAAGGLQGGTTDTFLDAMHTMRRTIDEDFGRNYIARWNDESHWNKYLFDHPPSVVLNPSYVYPDSMVQEYYVKLWGRDYPPKIITLTKPFTVSKEGGDAAREMMQTL